MKNIFNLSKIFIKENNNINLIKDNKINKKSFLFWIIIILFIGIFYISSELITYLKKIGKPEIFLNGYFLFLEILLIIQSIMLCTNIFYFSKDLENILPLPFKPIEILISKFNTLIFMLYGTELIFAFIPFIIYGIYTNMNLIFFINLIFVLIIFPIFIGLIISVIMMFLMKIIKIFKNKDLMQLIISFILISVVIMVANLGIKYVFQNSELIENNSENILNNINEKIIKINKYFLTINPLIKILKTEKIFINLIKIIFINFCGILIFIYLGNKLYLKQLLKNNFYFKNKKNKKINIEKRINKKDKAFAYIKKEFNVLLKNPLFFIQSIYPVILVTIMVCVLITIFIPKIIEISQMEEYKEQFENLKFDFEAVCIILGLTQIVGLFNYSSVTCFSRDGQNAFVNKYLPISLYKQFLYKNIPQIFINILCTGIILIILKLKINIKYILIIFILNIFMIIINSFILSFIDLINPKLNWKAEYELLKNNKNKLFQYALIVLNILFLIYFKKLLIRYNLNFTLIIFGIILLSIIFIIKFILKKYENKFFKKIK